MLDGTLDPLVILAEAEVAVRLLIVEGGAILVRLFIPNAIGVGVGASLFRDIVLIPEEAVRPVFGVGRTVLAGPRGFGAVGARPILMR